MIQTLASLHAPTVLGQGLVEAPTTEGAYGGLFRLYLTIASLIGGAVLLWLLVSLVRFRERRGRMQAPVDVAGSGAKHRGHPLVFGIMAVGISIVLFATMFGTLGTVHEFEHPPPGDALHLDAVGFQFGWTFRYPEAFETLNELVVPADHIVQLNVTSQDVIHKFQLRAYRIGVDATPGRTNHVWFRPTETGTFDAWCAELCGVGHTLMRFKVHVMAPDDFAAWARQMASGEVGGLLTQPVQVSVRNASVEPARLETFAGVRLDVHATNDGNRARSLSFDAPANLSTPVLEPGQSAWLNFTVRDAWLDPRSSEANITYRWNSSAEAEAGMTGTLVVRAARTVPVKLNEWSVTVASSVLAVNETVRYHVTNAGTAPHDFTVGHWASKDPDERIRWRLPLLQAGESADLLVRPDSAGSWDAWCEVPSHAQLGMRTQLEVTSP